MSDGKEPIECADCGEIAMEYVRTTAGWDEPRELHECTECGREEYFNV